MKTATHSPLLEGSVLAEEIAWESNAVRAGVARYRDLAQKAIVRGDGASLKPAERRLLYWLHPLVAELRKERRAVKSGQSGVGRGIYGPLLLQIPPPRLAVLTLHEIIGQCMKEPDGARFVRVAYAIGRAAVAEISLSDMRKEKPVELRDLLKTIKRPRPEHYNRWANKTLDDPVWNRKVCVHFGAYLIWAVIETVSASNHDEEFKLAFHHEKLNRGAKTIAQVRMDTSVFEAIERDHRFRELMRPRYLPTIIPPLPWLTDERGNLIQGGYVQIRTPFISKPTATQKAALAAADLSEVYECLTAVTAPGWRLNESNHQGAHDIWATGGDEALEIPRQQDFEKPTKPADFETNEEAKKEWKREASRVHRQNIRLKSERVETINMFNVAGLIAERQAFWFPHQLDFRGRAYPIPQHLNHHGNDVRRGMLEFARGVPLDDRAMFWLRVHAANKFGYDKVSFEDREQWTLAHAKEIRRTAKDFESEWWKRAKKPWQFRAACIALHDKEAAEHLPIDLDGTANGVQHYTAMGRDQDGAFLVNMMPSDRPSDFYSKVAENVVGIVSRDAPGNAVAAAVLPLIDRDTVKQTTMTTVYGVTMVGAREQIKGRLKEAGLKDRELFEASMYLSRVVLDGIGQSIESAKLIMDCLRNSARAICALGDPVSWMTRIGLPVVQPYRRYKTVQVRTILQNVTVAVEDESVPIWVKRQCDGIAPNFIHSLDSSHMFMTARTCYNQDIDFAAVHDCFRVHAANVDRGAEILRDEFVNLHERDVLAETMDYWAQKYPKAKLQEPPPRGTYDINNVRLAPHFFN